MNYLLLADGIQNLCSGTHQILELIGWVLTVFKIAIPLLIIALGLIDLGKAAVSSKPEEIKKTATSLLWRIVGGIIIFFIPMIVMLIFGWISGWGSAVDNLGCYSRNANGTCEIKEWDICYDCITSPWSNETCRKITSKYDNK